jgi:hypothetical protein
MIGPSQASAVRSTSVGPPASDRPSSVRGCDQRRVGSPSRVPSLFHVSHGRPCSSRNGLASIEPPRSVWHRKGSVETSTYGPSGNGEKACDRHCRPVEASAVV